MSLPTLDPIEIRVLGSLVEKSLATPDAYPLTLNALRSACNQSSSREPVMDLSEREVSQALDRLMRRRIVGTASGAGHRVAKFRHAMAEVLDLSRRELAVLAVLMLRGPQTPGEIRSRVGRMADLADVAEAEEVLWLLSDRETHIVAQLPREPGRSADRFAHTLAGDVSTAAPEADAENAEPPPPTIADRLLGLEAEVAQLKAELQGLRERLGDVA